MGDFVLPPSPNWFLPAVSSGNEAGLYAFGSKNDVLVYDISMINSKESKSFDSTGQPPKLVTFYSEHSLKVLGVCLSPDPTQWICCSCQEDIIKLWDVRSCVTIQDTSHVEIKAKLTCMSWSPADIDAVYASSDKGTVFIWNLKSNALSSYDFSKEYIACIAASPHYSNVAAVGYRTGSATIVSFESGRALTLHRLRSQEAEIYSISWCPVKGESCSKEEGALLAVAGRHFLRVWSSLRGKEIFGVKLNPASVSRRDTSDSSAKKNWASVVWSKQNPQHIIFSGSQGDLLYINIQVEGQQDVVKFSVSGINKHTRMIFNVVEVGAKLCSFALDRSIVIWDNPTKSGLISWTSFAGNIFCARVSPLDPGRIAIGAGDNNIRIWNQNNKSNPGDIVHIYNGIRSKVTYVAWHPEKEGFLAFGMEDGSVGICNTLSSKAPEMSKTFHKKTVYVVCWAPALKAEKGSSELQVYSVGDGTVLQHFFDQSRREAVNLMDAIRYFEEEGHKNLTISELSWRHDYTVFALGRIDGSVALYGFPSLELLYLVEIQTKLINCVRWHPFTTSQSPALSPCSNVVAFAGNDCFISIIDLSYQSGSSLSTKAILGNKSGVKEHVHITQSQGQLPVGKNMRITDLCWSPHQDGLLASVGYSGVAIVWDARTMSKLACYKHELGRLLTVVWSHLDSDTVMSGGTDNTFRKWRVSAQPKEVGKNKKKKRANKSRAIAEDTNSEDTASTSDFKELEELLKSKKRELLVQMNGSDASFELNNGTLEETSGSVTQGTLEPKNAVTNDPNDKSTSSVKSQLWTPVTDARATSEVRGSHGKYGVRSADDAIPDVQGSDGKFGARDEAESEDEEDDDDDRCLGLDENIPAVEDLVPPAKRLFPGRPVPRPAPTVGSSAADGRGKTRQQLKTKPRGLFPVSAAANNRARGQLHNDILDLTKVMAGETRYAFGKGVEVGENVGRVERFRSFDHKRVITVISENVYSGIRRVNNRVRRWRRGASGKAKIQRYFRLAGPVSEPVRELGLLWRTIQAKVLHTKMRYSKSTRGQYTLRRYNAYETLVGCDHIVCIVVDVAFKFRS
ncbi:hypothetical protein RRG08_040090 [Elysia crispata]|uniref:Gem-associated protein 5 second beta-propeller domain-containing protein n=1 Tax=Elysia crispata TaxID=231223 RepID=A0AAE0XVV0_9GAST|nr:hypothetical protein RRG08_040090 [Elysia crispata]